jgi:hypothetical protein
MSLNENETYNKFSDGDLGNFKPMSHTWPVHQMYFPVLIAADMFRDFRVTTDFREFKKAYELIRIIKFLLYHRV